MDLAKFKSNLAKGNGSVVVYLKKLVKQVQGYQSGLQAGASSSVVLGITDSDQEDEDEEEDFNNDDDKNKDHGGGSKGGSVVGSVSKAEHRSRGPAKHR